ncbi:MAG TPA: hypothetical protein PKL56_16790 [Cyclobacteriaceae bacterium]|nr:hypothetical protein [Cyclobacteriaceae bacterium]HMV09284.1 hypothetical protein [Cyclobacteriaceae bacterium]HMX01916.1 hypothetical protein [Cyclobacteriaceae bacterium]HMX50839.1 hypothetical protein [Cyclobacteriaceae bacterium]HMY94739.1 hypothetical protein [Cyclobacteriaceae bacterium]
MATVGEIESFLKEFKEKLEFWGVIFRSDREKNYATLKELELSVIQVKGELGRLAVSDYCDGPITERLYNGACMWVFGRTVRAREIYIKITMGHPGNEVLCISFHFPVTPMKYPYKN